MMADTTRRHLRGPKIPSQEHRWFIFTHIVIFLCYVFQAVVNPVLGSSGWCDNRPERGITLTNPTVHVGRPGWLGYTMIDWDLVHNSVLTCRQFSRVRGESGGSEGVRRGHIYKDPRHCDYASGPDNSCVNDHIGQSGVLFICIAGNAIPREERHQHSPDIGYYCCKQNRTPITRKWSPLEIFHEPYMRIKHINSYYEWPSYFLYYSVHIPSTIFVLCQDRHYVLLATVSLAHNWSPIRTLINVGGWSGDRYNCIGYVEWKIDCPEVINPVQSTSCIIWMIYQVTDYVCWINACVVAALYAGCISQCGSVISFCMQTPVVLFSYILQHGRDGELDRSILRAESWQLNMSPRHVNITWMLVDTHRLLNEQSDTSYPATTIITPEGWRFLPHRLMDGGPLETLSDSHVWDCSCMNSKTNVRSFTRCSVSIPLGPGLHTLWCYLYLTFNFCICEICYVIQVRHGHLYMDITIHINFLVHSYSYMMQLRHVYLYMDIAIHINLCVHSYRYLFFVSRCHVILVYVIIYSQHRHEYRFYLHKYNNSDIVGGTEYDR